MRVDAEADVDAFSSLAFPSRGYRSTLKLNALRKVQEVISFKNCTCATWVEVEAISTLTHVFQMPIIQYHKYIIYNVSSYLIDK